MKTLTRIALFALVIAACAPAFAKTTLVASSPAKDQVLDAPPIELRLTFNERVDPRTCRIKLVSGDGRRMDADRPHADRSDPNSLVASVPVLRKGSWRARWTAIGADGRKAHGDLSFSIR